MTYTHRDLAQAVLDAHPDSRRGLDMFRGGFSKDKKAYQVRLCDALLRAFGIDLKADLAVKMLLRGVVDSNAAITHPLAHFGEYGLLVNKLKDTSVFERMREIADLNTRSHEVHLDIVEELIAFLRPAVDVVTSDDLKAAGFTETPPNGDDYEMDY